MFKKLVSNLPFNPGLLQEVSGFAKQLRREVAVRRLGFIFLALALLVQFFAFIRPAKISLATSNNDIIYGATNKQAVISSLENNVDTKGHADIKAIYDHYGISLSDINAATTTSIKSHDRDYIVSGRINKLSNGARLLIDVNSPAIYEHPLTAWDKQNKAQIYSALTGTASGEGSLKNQPFWILLNGCGCVVHENKPGSPKLEIVKLISSKNGTRAGETVSYRLDFRNTGRASASNITISDSLPANLTFDKQSTKTTASFIGQSNSLKWTINQVDASTDWQSIVVTAKIKTVADISKTICGDATLSEGQNQKITASCKTADVAADPNTHVKFGIKVDNLTQKINDFSGRTAKAGDVLRYTVSATNSGTEAAKDYAIDSDNLGDVIEYADMAGSAGASFDKQNNQISWPAETIAAGQTITKTFSIKIKDPLPTSPASLSDPLSYDYRIQNSYGNETTVNIDRPLNAKLYSLTASSALPRLNSLLVLLVSGFITTLVGFSYLRSRQMTKELSMIQKDAVS